MHLDDFDFELPRRLIADRLCEPRNAARLLVIPATGPLRDRRVADLPLLLRRGDLLVFDDTKVIPARLRGRRGAALVEVTLHRDLGGGAWRAFAKGARRLRIGDRIEFAENFVADVAEKHPEGDLTLRFDLEGKVFHEALVHITTQSRCRPTSGARAAATRATAPTIRQSSPAPRALSRRRPRVSISPLPCSTHSPSPPCRARYVSPGQDGRPTRPQDARRMGGVC